MGRAPLLALLLNPQGSRYYRNRNPLEAGPRAVAGAVHTDGGQGRQVKYRILPRTDLELSEVGFDLWTVVNRRLETMDERDGVRLLREAVELGVTFFDTADIDGKGYGEEILAKALGKGRHDAVIGSKFGYDFYDAPPGRSSCPQKFDPPFIRRACEQSLRRLRADYIDLYQIHDPGMDTIERDEVFETLEALVKEGKIRFYAIAFGPGAGGLEAGEASMRYRDVKALQIPYGIVRQEPAQSLFPIAAEKEIGVIARTPRPVEPGGPPGLKAQALRFLAEEMGGGEAQGDVKFCLAQPSVASVIPMVTGLETLRECAAASEAPGISVEALGKLEELWREGFEATASRGAATGGG